MPARSRLGKCANNLLGTGPVIVNSPATLNLNGNGNLTNEFTFNGAKVTNGNSFNASLNGPVTLEATTTFDLFTTGNMSIGGIVSGPGGLTKLGTGQGPLILSGINTYTGPTTVAAGTLKCDNMDALGSGDLSISTGGAKVNLNYTGTKTVASLTLGGVAQIVPGTYGSIASGADFQDDTYFTSTGTGTVTIVPSAYITAFGTNVLGSGAVISPVVANAATIAWTVPFGTVLADLAPEFTLSYEATCDRTSGAIPSPNFSAGPVVYTVTSSDSLITNAYTVTVTVLGAGGYAGWAATNAGGQTPDQDYDNDGVDNGIEYFMGQTGSSFTPCPAWTGPTRSPGRRIRPTTAPGRSKPRPTSAPGRTWPAPTTAPRSPTPCQPARASCSSACS